MTLFESIETIATADGTSAVDWDGAQQAAKAANDPGPLDVDETTVDAYRSAVSDAQDQIGNALDHSFSVPSPVLLYNRHHWIDQNATTIRRVMEPLTTGFDTVPRATRIVNTGSMALMLGYLSTRVMGQYDPQLFGDQSTEDHRLYFVVPNIEAIAAKLDIERPRFRRWIAFHEVTHAAQFHMAPWLAEYLADRIRVGMEAFTEGSIRLEIFEDLYVAMTAIEGFAELVMDQAYPGAYEVMRETLDHHRQQQGPLAAVISRFLGLDLKRRQYERGRAFFETIEQEWSLATACTVWEEPAMLPTAAELADPQLWIERIDS